MDFWDCNFGSGAPCIWVILDNFWDVMFFPMHRRIRWYTFNTSTFHERYVNLHWLFDFYIILIWWKYQSNTFLLVIYSQLINNEKVINFLHNCYHNLFFHITIILYAYYFGGSHHVIQHVVILAWALVLFCSNIT